MKKAVKNYENYSRNIKRLLILAGILPKSYPITQRIILTLSLANFVFVLLGSFYYCYQNADNVMNLTKGIGLLFTLISATMKIFVFLLHRSEIEHLNLTLSARYENDLLNEKYYSIVLKHFRIFSGFFYLLSWMTGFIAVMTVAVLPNVVIIRNNNADRDLDVANPLSFPFVYELGSLVYWIIQLLKIFCAACVFTVTCGVDSVFGLYTFQLCGELNLLAHLFKNLKRSSVDYEEQLRECIERHLQLGRSKKTLENIFSVLVIWLAITSALILCSLLFQLDHIIKSENPGKIGYILGHIVMKLIQAYMYAWYGCMIDEESKMCINSMYFASWPGSGDVKMMRDAIIVLSQRSLTFTAKGFMQLRMEMFSTIVKASVSYFFLLRTLEEKANQKLV